MVLWSHRRRERAAAAVIACVLALVAGRRSVAHAPTDFGFTATGGPLAIRGPNGMDAIDPEACVDCHADVAGEWRESMHARSFVDPIFQGELAESRDTRACVSCHAPLDVARTGGRAASIGVACAACHLRNGTILARGTAGPERAPHPIRRVPDLGGPEFCGSCHDFAFPVQRPGPGAPYEPGSPQQRTLGEWQSTPHARNGLDCVACHMPEVVRAPGRSGRSHRVRSLEDRDFVATALDVRASTRPAEADIEVAVDLRIAGAGHAVPTGDIFRELHVEATNACGTDRWIGMRRFAEVAKGRGFVLRDSYDDRVLPDEPRHVVLRLPRCGGPIRYEVRVLRLAESAAIRRGFDTRAYVIPLASGILEQPGGQR